MIWCKTISLLLIEITLFALNNVDADVAQKFSEEEIVPDVLEKTPENLLKVSYNKKILEPGDKLTPTETKLKPEIEWNYDSENFYAMIMVDPDAPSRKDQSWGEFLHWSVVNIPGDDFEKGETLAEYLPCGPPKDTGYHRYTFVLYKQPEKLNFEEQPISELSINGRPKFSLSKFAKKYSFGDPIAGNMFLAEFDDFVTGFLQKMGINL